MPAGILIESGQADLLLISWLGVDFLNRGERVYRLLGCELTYHGELPARRDAALRDPRRRPRAARATSRLFFFHYDCTSDGQPRLTVRERPGRLLHRRGAGRDRPASCGTPTDDQPDPAAPLAGPRPGVTPAASFSDAQVAAFAAGDIMAAFGPAFLRCASHTRTPRIAGGRLLLLDAVDELDLQGGPWGRGYLRATMDVTPERLVLPRPLQERPLHARHPDVRGLPAGDGVLPGGAGLHARARRLALRAGARGALPAALPRPGDPDVAARSSTRCSSRRCTTAPSRRCSPTCCAPSTGSRRSTAGAWGCAWCPTGRSLERAS